MDLIKTLKLNEIIKDILYHYLLKNGYFDDLYDDPDEFIYHEVDVVGYAFNSEKESIEAKVIYEDEVCDSGIGYETYDISIKDFEEFMKRYEKRIENSLK